MQIIQSLFIGLAALRRNKLRSLLTMLGIIIGISAVVGMVSIGDGAKFLVLAEFERMGGSDLIICFRPRWIQREDGTWIQNKAPVYLEYEDIDAIMMSCPSVKSITGEIDTMARPISYKGETKHFRFEGVTPLYQEVHNWYIQSGRFIQQEDLDRNESVCVIGTEVQRDLFGKTDPIGQELKIGRQRFTVVGVMEEKGDKMATEGWDKKLIVPFTTMWTRFIGNQKRGFELWLKAESFEKVDQALAEVMITLRRRHGSEEHFQVLHCKSSFGTGRKSQSGPQNSAWRCREHLAIGRRHRYHEYHVSFRYGTHAGNWAAQSRWCATPRYSAAIPNRISCAECLWRTDWNSHQRVHYFCGRMGSHNISHQRDGMARSGIFMGGGCCFRFFRVYRYSIWHSSCLQGGAVDAN